MNQIGQYIEAHPFWSIFFAALLWSFLSSACKSGRRALTILIHGYPPPHCDVDGDPVTKEEEEDEEDGGDEPEADARPWWMKVMGLQTGFTRDQMLASYRALVQKHHPDKGGTAKNFRTVQEAYKLAQQSFATR